MIIIMIIDYNGDVDDHDNEKINNNSPFVTNSLARAKTARFRSKDWIWQVMAVAPSGCPSFSSWATIGAGFVHSMLIIMIIAALILIIMMMKIISIVISIS